jgi:hypothetical protein
LTIAPVYDVIQIPDQFRSGLTFKENIMKANITPVSFDSHARAIIGGYKAFDAASGKLTATVNREMQGHIDAWFIANGKDEASVKALGASIRDSQVVLDIVATGAMEKKTFTEYAQSAMRALHYGVPFTADLKNDPEMGLPWGKAGKGGAAKSGKVSSTSRDDLDKTITKAIEQARMLGLLEFAADLVDLATDSLDGFTETK